MKLGKSGGQLGNSREGFLPGEWREGGMVLLVVVGAPGLLRKL